MGLNPDDYDFEGGEGRTARHYKDDHAKCPRLDTSGYEVFDGDFWPGMNRDKHAPSSSSFIFDRQYTPVMHEVYIAGSYAMGQDSVRNEDTAFAAVTTAVRRRAQMIVLQTGILDALFSLLRLDRLKSPNLKGNITFDRDLIMYLEVALIEALQNNPAGQLYVAKRSFHGNKKMEGWENGYLAELTALAIEYSSVGVLSTKGSEGPAFCFMLAWLKTVFKRHTLTTEVIQFITSTFVGTSRDSVLSFQHIGIVNGFCSTYTTDGPILRTQSRVMKQMFHLHGCLVYPVFGLYFLRYPKSGTKRRLQSYLSLAAGEQEALRRMHPLRRRTAAPAVEIPPHLDELLINHGSSLRVCVALTQRHLAQTVKGRDDWISYCRLGVRHTHVSKLPTQSVIEFLNDFKDDRLPLFRPEQPPGDRLLPEATFYSSSDNENLELCPWKDLAILVEEVVASDHDYSTSLNAFLPYMMALLSLQMNLVTGEKYIRRKAWLNITPTNSSLSQYTQRTFHTVFEPSLWAFCTTFI